MGVKHLVTLHSQSESRERGECGCYSGFFLLLSRLGLWLMGGATYIQVMAFLFSEGCNTPTDMPKRCVSRWFQIQSSQQWLFNNKGGITYCTGLLGGFEWGFAFNLLHRLRHILQFHCKECNKYTIVWIEFKYELHSVLWLWPPTLAAEATNLQFNPSKSYITFSCMLHSCPDITPLHRFPLMNSVKSTLQNPLYIFNLWNLHRLVSPT